jgi:hypothetical protein
MDVINVGAYTHTKHTPHTQDLAHRGLGIGVRESVSCRVLLVLNLQSGMLVIFLCFHVYDARICLRLCFVLGL